MAVSDVRMFEFSKAMQGSRYISVSECCGSEPENERLAKLSRQL